MALEPTRRAPGGGVYKQEVIFCHKEGCKKCDSVEGHGPYWYLYSWGWNEKRQKNTTRKKYIGKTLPAELTEEHHEAAEGSWTPS